jgi:hypothetical protein
LSSVNTDLSHSIALEASLRRELALTLGLGFVDWLRR